MNAENRERYPIYSPTFLFPKEILFFIQNFLTALSDTPNVLAICKIEYEIIILLISAIEGHIIFGLYAVLHFLHIRPLVLTSLLLHLPHKKGNESEIR